MADAPRRFDHVRRRVRAGLAVGAVAVLLGFGGLGLALLFGGQDAVGSHIFASVALLAAALFLAALALTLSGILDLLIKSEANTFRSHDVLRDVQALLDEQLKQLTIIAENVQLSEAALSISHRGKERNVLRLAINEEIIKGDWEAAYALVEQLEDRHGYRNEAARLRAEVDRSRELNKKHKVQDAISSVKAHMEAHEWDRARREMDALLAAQPDNAEVQHLPQLFAKLRSEHKRRLLKQWDQAVQRNEIDHGIATLKELDQYLTPNEAAALEESARGVFRAKLHNLGVQFSLAVTERDWPAAVRVGDQIMHEFPNSRMSREVAEKIDLLRKWAEEAHAQPAAEA